MKSFSLIVVLFSLFCAPVFAEPVLTESVESTQLGDQFGVIGLLLLGAICLVLARRRAV
ncbi:MAG: hypothetical protein WBA20_19975 [Ketobacter sp.]|uniref:hypothetical protein n=1 Tax=Ketobacter sp. MCCC 1A13808 TaxID=2602738 RepID=UPI0012EBADEC|nr:hypothetical protein [Ketobacter sp. MCCC 1A13808]|tara:strand:+ start:343 stop:519 length:177 start_codon:yes stop_codon:yes gene_type:complete